MDRDQLLFVDAWVFGLGWICFGYGGLAEIERIEAAASHAPEKRWPGKPARPTRIRQGESNIIKERRRKHE